MKKNILKILGLMLIVCMAFTIVACNNLPFFNNGDNNTGDKNDDKTDDQNKPGDVTDKPGGDDTNEPGDNTGKEDPDEPGGDDNDKPVEDPLLLYLIQNGKANFQVVFTEASASSAAAIANSFVERLKEMNVLPKNAEPVIDSDASKVGDCEIIIGADALNRGEDCCISTRYLGVDGQAIKIVGNRVIIATGDPELLNNRFNSFVRNQMGISTSATKVNDTITLQRAFDYEKLTTYRVSSITVNGVDMKTYKLVLDVDSIKDEELNNIKQFRNNLYDASGYWLDVGTSDKIDTYSNAFIIRKTEDAGEAGFRAYVAENGNFIVECAYDNAFNGAFGEFAINTFVNASGELKFNYNTKVDEETQETSIVNVYEKIVSIAYYEDFGAKGDGKTKDFEAIYNTHVYANRGGQKVMSRGGSAATYFIDATSFNRSIPVKTDVDLNGCTFLVDDTGSDAFTYYNLHLFNFQRDIPEIILDDVIKNVPVFDADGNPVYEKNGEQKMTVDNIIDDERFQNIKLMNKTEENKDDPNVYDDFSWLVKEGLIESTCLIRVYNKMHRDFIRHGSNQNSGNVRTDVFVVSPDGTISEETPIVYEFENISKIEIFRTDDKPITFENGNFINICCRTVAETTYTTPQGKLTKYACKWKGYQRTLGIFRTNVTVKNLKHEMQNEPNVGYIPNGSGYTKEGDSHFANYGSRHESYPYYGFFYIYTTYNFNAYDSILTGHTVYYEDKPATASTGGKVPNPVAMGTYDLIIEYSSHVYLHNVKQVNSSTPTTGIGDGRYWGIMSSNGARNIFFYDCEINRFDAHRGFWNAELHNTTIGHSFQIVGGGYLVADNVTKVTKGNFMTLRGDYGATFNGDITLKDCKQLAFQTYNTARKQANTTLNDSNRNVLESCVIFDPGYEVENTGWLDTPGLTPEEAGKGAYWLWDFGYTCYMPRNITIDNFTYACEKMSIFDELPNIIFEKTYEEGVPVNKNTVKYPYQITESITFVNYTESTNGFVNLKDTGDMKGTLVMTFFAEDTKIQSIPKKYVRKED